MNRPDKLMLSLPVGFVYKFDLLFDLICLTFIKLTQSHISLLKM